MIVRKRFKMLVSKKFLNNTIVSFEFGTELEEEGVNEKELFEKAYKSTLRDITESGKNNEAIKLAVDAIVEGIEQEKKFKDVEKDFEKGFEEYE